MNILCRPGPSMISTTGGDLYVPMTGWSTNTFLDSFQPRPEEGTILAPCAGQEEDSTLHVVRLDLESRKPVLTTALWLLQNAGELMPLGLRDKDPIALATEGRWTTQFFFTAKDKEPEAKLTLSGPESRFLEIRSTDAPKGLSFTVGRETPDISVKQEVFADISLEKIESRRYSLLFGPRHLDGLKTLLGLSQAQTPLEAATRIVMGLFESDQYEAGLYHPMISIAQMTGDRKKYPLTFQVLETITGGKRQRRLQRIVFPTEFDPAFPEFEIFCGREPGRASLFTIESGTRGLSVELKGEWSSYMPLKPRQVSLWNGALGFVLRKKAGSRHEHGNNLQLLGQIHAEPELRQILKTALETNSPIERRILTWRYPWLEGEDGRGLTLKEVGEKYNLSPKRIGQLEAKGLEKLVRHIDEGKLAGVETVPGIERLPVLLASWRRTKNALDQEDQKEKRGVFQRAFGAAALKLGIVNETVFRIAKSAALSGYPEKRARDLAERWEEAFDESLQTLQGRIEGAEVLARMSANQSFTAARTREKARKKALYLLERARSGKSRVQFVQGAVKSIASQLDGIDRREEVAERIAERAWIRRTSKSSVSSLARRWKRAYSEAVKSLEGRDGADKTASKIADEVFEWHYSDLAARELVMAIARTKKL